MYTTDSRGNVIGNGPFIRLMSYKWKTPSPYFISRPNSVTGVCERVRETKDFRMRQGKMYNYIKTEYIPEVFTFMTLTFLETEMVNVQKMEVMLKDCVRQFLRKL